MRSALIPVCGAGGAFLSGCPWYFYRKMPKNIRIPLISTNSDKPLVLLERDVKIPAVPLTDCALTTVRTTADSSEETTRQPNAMTPTDIECAGRLLHHFDASALGDGNLNARANVLAAMALSIANTQRPDSAIQGKDGSRTALGCGLIAAGSLSAGLISERVIVPLQIRQSRVSDNVRHWQEVDKRRHMEAARKGRPVNEWGEDPEDQHHPVLGALTRVPMMLEGEGIALSARLLGSPSGWGFREVRDHPLVFASAAGPGDVPRLMASAHLGKPQVHVALADGGQCAAYARVCNVLMDGCHLSHPVALNVRGEVLVTDSGNALADAVRDGGAGDRWLSRLVWLSDHKAGPEFEIPTDATSGGRLDQVIARYGAAMDRAWARRLNTVSSAPTVIECELREAQAGWVGFLADHETEFPGITGNARRLPASLNFGLFEIQKTSPATRGAPMMKSGDVMALARMLVLRMLNARSLMRRDSRRARIAEHARAIRSKLAEGPLTVRELARRSHRLSAADCEEALDLLAAGGFVKRTTNAWCLIPSTAPLPSTATLTVNV
jgi:hypothetical protein